MQELRQKLRQADRPARPRAVARQPAGADGSDQARGSVDVRIARFRRRLAAGGGRIVALAERSLTRGQLAPAVDQIALLDDQHAVATEWLRNASARLNVDKATAMLGRRRPSTGWPARSKGGRGRSVRVDGRPTAAAEDADDR